SEAKTAHDLPAQPAGNRTDDQHDDNAVYSNHDVPPDTAGHERPAATLRCSLGCNLESVAQVDQTFSNQARTCGQGRRRRAFARHSVPIVRCSIKDGRLALPFQVPEATLPAVAIGKPPQAVRKDLYWIGEVPPLGHVPARMHAWAIRKERDGPPETSMQ